MGLLNRKTNKQAAGNQAILAEMALRAIHDGVIITDQNGVIQFINPAAVTMSDCGGANNAIGLDYGLIIKLQTKDGREFTDDASPLAQAMRTGQPLDPYHGCLVSVRSGKCIPIAIAVFSADGVQNRIITFRDITKELEEEGEQAEFISTASHEMRTPVASIEGYLSLALNPQTATIDERARGYLNAAHAASQHLGKLFQDLLDVTKLDDGKIKPHFEPVEMVGLVKSITDGYIMRAKEAKLSFTFGSDKPLAFGENRRMEQVVYSYIDVSFLREILDNLIENAIKYTPEGGSIYVNVRGDGDRVLINVTDTGIGISADDLSHIFQKFYRADNSDTRTIGGTGLGLYLVKQRVDAMDGRVWAESAFGEGSTFYVSLPRITGDEYEKRMIAVRNQQLQEQLQKSMTNTQTVQTPSTPNSDMSSSVTPALVQPSVPTPTIPTPPAPTPSMAPSVMSASAQPIQSQPLAVASVPNPTALPPQPSPPQPPVAVSPPSQPPTPPLTTPINPTINNNLNGESK